jgi:hypothetical protein
VGGSAGELVSETTSSVVTVDGDVIVEAIVDVVVVVVIIVVVAVGPT